MNWNNILLILGIIGSLAFLIIGLIILFSAFTGHQLYVDTRLPGYGRYVTIAGVGMVLFAIFIGFFIVSTISTNYIVKLSSIILGTVLFGLPAVGLMLLSLVKILLMRPR